MSDERTAMRVDALIRRIDVPVTPDDAFIRASADVLRQRAGRARAQDGSVIGRLSRDIGSAIHQARSPLRRGPALSTAVLLLILLIAAVLTVIVGSQRRLPPPFGLAGNGRIAYQVGDHLYTTDLNGANQRQLTLGNARESDARFSPDGARVAYRGFARSGADQTSADVVIADANGRNPIVIAGSVTALSHVSWSPDSRSVAFSGRIDGGPETGYVAAADGSGTLIGIGSFGGSAWDPTWSPDGMQLAIGTRDGVVVVHRDGTDPRLVSKGHYEEVGELGGTADWSPDGASILFSAIATNGEHQIFLLHLDGTPERGLSPVLPAREGTFSPDGSHIAYMRVGIGRGPIVVVTDSAGDGARVLPGYYAWCQPVWSPDGAKIIVTDGNPGADDVEGPPVRVILDAFGNELPVVIRAPGTTPEGFSDLCASWQRVAP